LLVSMTSAAPSSWLPHRAGAAPRAITGAPSSPRDGEGDGYFAVVFRHEQRPIFMIW